jgi:hypothetical protein
MARTGSNWNPLRHPTEWAGQPTLPEPHCTSSSPQSGLLLEVRSCSWPGTRFGTLLEPPKVGSAGLLDPTSLDATMSPRSGL